MIKAIIFDCFGVLAVDGWTPFKREHFGDNPELMQYASDLNRQTDCGMMAYEDYVKEIAALAGVAPSEFRSAIESVVLDEELLRYVERELKPTYKIGMLSNVAGDWVSRSFTDKQRKLFDALTLSADTGFAKPDSRAYQAACRQLGVEPEACIFVDDQERYCTAAEELGMQAIYYRNFDDFKAKITTILEKTGTR